MSTTSIIHVHVLPNVPSLQMLAQDREVVGVHAVEVDPMDYPSQQAIAALNAVKASAMISNPEHLTFAVFEPNKKHWLVTPQGTHDFPSDGDYSGMVEVPLMPLGTTLISQRDHVEDNDGSAQVTPAGSHWEVIAADLGSIQLRAVVTGVMVFISPCQVHESFMIHTGFEGDGQLIESQLDDKYNPDGGGEHPMFTKQMWREAVANLDTISGYWAWLENEVAHAHWS